MGEIADNNSTDSKSISMAELRTYFQSKWFCIAQNIVSLILLVGVIALLTVLILGRSGKDEKTHDMDPQYAAESAKILASMNMEADPCEDFYEYACGGFRANALVDLDAFDLTPMFGLSTLSMLPRMFDKIIENKEGNSCDSELKMAQLYHSCMDEFSSVGKDGSVNIQNMNTTQAKSVQTIHEWFVEKYGFNIYKSVSSHDYYNGSFHVLVWVMGNTLMSPFFEVSIESESELHVSYPRSYGFQYLVPMTDDGQVNVNVLDYIIDLIYEPFNSESEDKEVLKSNINETVQSLFEIFNDTGSQTADAAQIETVLQFKKLIPQWAVEKYEKSPDSINIEFPRGAQYLEDFINSDQLFNANNFMQLQFISSVYLMTLITLTQTREGCRFVDAMAEQLDDRAAERMYERLCASHAREREIYCLNYLSNNFEFALVSANAYMKYYTGEQAFYDIEELTEKIRTSILTRIEKNVLNETTRAGLTEYIKRIKVRPRSDQIECDFPDVLVQDLDIQWNSFKPHAYYMLEMQEFQHNKFMKEVEPKMYSRALSVNAFYSPEQQQVRFLSFLINSLYSDQHHTPSLYGGIGSVLAHEFGHSLDPRIIPGYYMSALMDPQTNATLNTFSDCLVDLYNKAGVSGETSLQDNYSDIFGLTIVVETFKREENRKKIQEALDKSPILYHFTPEELMFVTYGQVWCQASVNKRKAHNLGQWSHAPNEARINIVLSAIPEFSETYKCPADSFMTSGQHCKVWP